MRPKLPRAGIRKSRLRKVEFFDAGQPPCLPHQLAKRVNPAGSLT